MISLSGTGPLLLIDDDPVDISIMRRCFQKSKLAERFSLTSLTSGEAALAHMDAVHAGDEPVPSLILLDINMPRLNGFEILERIRARPTFSELPAVVFVSNSDNPKDIARAAELGAAFSEKFSDWRAGVAFFDGMDG